MKVSFYWTVWEKIFLIHLILGLTNTFFLILIFQLLLSLLRQSKKYSRSRIGIILGLTIEEQLLNGLRGLIQIGGRFKSLIKSLMSDFIECGNFIFWVVLPNCVQ